MKIEKNEKEKMGNYFRIDFRFIHDCEYRFIKMYDAPPPIEKVKFTGYYSENVKSINPESRFEVQNELAQIEGVSAASVNIEDGKLTVLYFPNVTNEETVKSLMESFFDEKLVNLNIKPAQGKGCPVNGFLDKCAPFFIASNL